MLDGQQEQQHLPFKIWIDLKRTTESITRVLPQTLCSSQERPRPPCSMPTISTSGSSGWWGMLGNIGIAGIRGMQQIQNCYRLWWIRRARGFTVKCTHIFPTVNEVCLQACDTPAEAVGAVATGPVLAATGARHESGGWKNPQQCAL